MHIWRVATKVGVGSSPAVSRVTRDLYVESAVPSIPRRWSHRLLNYLSMDVTLRCLDLATEIYHIKEPQLCRVRHNCGYAERRTMPNGHVFPRIRGDWHMTDSA